MFLTRWNQLFCSQELFLLIVLLSVASDAPYPRLGFPVPIDDPVESNEFDEFVGASDYEDGNAASLCRSGVPNVVAQQGALLFATKQETVHTLGRLTRGTSRL